MRAYKQIIAELIKAESILDLDMTAAQIDKEFDLENITWNEHEQLLDLLVKVSNGHYSRAGVKQVNTSTL